MTIHMHGVQSRMRRHLLGAAFVFDEISVYESMRWLYMTNLNGHKNAQSIS